jgi:catechol 2,3-dioxygenase-like lactoylglutathione lyase family enzyme
MLANVPLTTILPVVDLPRARAFYEQKLGLRGGHPKPDGKSEGNILCLHEDLA